MLDGVAQSRIVFISFCLELGAEPLVQGLQVVRLFLQTCLYAFGLLAGVGVLLKFLLEVGSCIFKLLLLVGQGVLNVLPFLLQNLCEVFAELILRHDAVYLHEGDFQFARFGLFGCRSFFVYLGCRFVTCCHAQYCECCNRSCF